MARRGAKRFRDFLRVAMTTKTARVLRTYVVDRTFEDHAKKCADPSVCTHTKSLPGARAFEAGIKIGRKRATLDLKCPFSFEDSDEQIKLLELLAQRIAWIADGQKKPVEEAMARVAQEIQAYARRNPMLVLAEAASSQSEPQEP